LILRLHQYNGTQLLEINGRILSQQQLSDQEESSNF